MRCVIFSWRMPAAVLALAWLAGCEPKPPEPKVAHAATVLPATAVTASATATAAVIVNDTPVAQQPLPPEVAELSEVAPQASLASLRASLGKFPHEGINYLEQGVLAERLRGLLGADYLRLLANMRTVSPLTEADGLWFVTGNRLHAGDAEAAAVVIDSRSNALRVWLQSAGQSREFIDPPTARIAWPEEVRIMRRNLGQWGP